MKLIPYYVACLLAVLVQVTLLGGDLSLNLVLAVVIVSSVYLRASDIVPIALICGLLLDLHTGNFFGFNMIFFVLAVLGAKFVLHLGERGNGYWSMIITLGILEILYLFIQFILVFSVERYYQLPAAAIIVLWQVILTILAGSLIYAVSIWWQGYIARSDSKKHWLWGR
jgi:hypothetical protein